MTPKNSKGTETSLNDLEIGQTYLVVSRLTGIPYAIYEFTGFDVGVCATFAVFKSDDGFDTFSGEEKNWRFWRVENCEKSQSFENDDFNKLNYSDLLEGMTVEFVLGNLIYIGKVVYVGREYGIISHANGGRTTVYPGWEFELKG